MALSGLMCSMGGFLPQSQAQEIRHPNVLFIVIDDLNDWLSVLDGDNPIKMPNLEKLAGKGALFTRAYCSAPVCNPSRASTLTGLRPHKTGVYGNKTDWRGALPNALTIQQYFMKHGYYSAGAGKVFHHHWDGAFHDSASFNDFLPMPKGFPDAPMPEKKLNGLDWYGTRNSDWGPYLAEAKDALDYKTATYGVDFLGREHKKPFILSIGIFRPHMPFYSPQEYFDIYTREKTRMPLVKADDWSDLPSGASALLRGSRWFWQGIEKATAEDPRAWEKMVVAYQACASFADAQIGRVLDALENSRYKENTVIVLWSDNGYHLGEKQHVEKFALWEKTTHVPLVFVASGAIAPGSKIETPVDLTSIYPTLVDLCGLEKKGDLDGTSLLPLFANPKAKHPPALTTYLQGNHSIRTERWRYIRYADGSEELYDHENDRNEWTNLALNPQHEKVLVELRTFLPEHNAAPAPDMVNPASRKKQKSNFK